MAWKGFVLVISSPGQAYQRMEQAWLASWRRQCLPGLALVLLSSAEQDAWEPLEAPSAWRLTTRDTDTYIPGILDKTIVALAHITSESPDAWVFRTNLSSHVDLATLEQVMHGLPDGHCLGFSPTFDHLSGCGMGLSPGAAGQVVRNRGLLDRSLVDDVAISGLLTTLKCPHRWTGRLDRVWPDGLVMHGVSPYYHVRVKGLDRDSDARVLDSLAQAGIPEALSWFTRTTTGSPDGSPAAPPP